MAIEYFYLVSLAYLLVVLDPQDETHARVLTSAIQQMNSKNKKIIRNDVMNAYLKLLFNIHF